MDDTETRLFHLHYHVPDVGYAERALAENGLPLRARFGSVDDEPVAVRPGEDTPDGFRFRLQDAQRGWANVTLTRGKRLRFDHLGVVTGAFDAVVERARDADWRVQGVDEPRTFLVTPWGFRIEVHPPGGRVASSLGSYEEGRFEDAVLSVPDPVEVDAGIRRVLGAGSGVDVRQGEGRPHVPRATVVGRAFRDGSTLRASSLAADGTSGPSEEE